MLSTQDSKVKRMEQKASRRKEILQAFIDLGSKAEVGRQFKISRERVSQIIENEVGSRSPIIQSPTWFDWKLLKRVAKIFRLTNTEIAKVSGVSIATVIHTLSGSERYIRNEQHRKDAMGGRILLGILYLVRRRLYHQEQITRDLISEFQKIKYGYSED